jgi:glycosyltransferase involved in cell wall biosynthesis
VIHLNQKNSILLSICIPTYNRSELLRSALYSLVPQLKEFQGEVELIVSDNNSSDNTKDVVDWAQQFGLIRYHRNNENIGANKNIVLCATKLALGDFCWILGDDDFVRLEAVKKILGIIKAYPEIDYIYVNIEHFSTDLLKNYPNPVSSKDLPEILPLGNKNPNEFYVEKWENLINPDISGVFLGAVQVSIVRRAIWSKYSSTLNIGEPFSSLDSTYPHVIIYANGLVGKKAYYIGKPLIIVIDGAREWIEFVPKICLVYLHKVLDYYEMYGVDSNQIENCRKYLVKNNKHLILKILKHNNIKDVNRVFAIRYVLKYWKYFDLKFGIKYIILKTPTLMNRWIKNKHKD